MKRILKITLLTAMLACIVLGCSQAGSTEYSFLLDLKTDSTGNGTIDTGSSTTNGDYNAGTMVTATAIANSGNSFLGWYDAETGGTFVSDQNPYTFSIENNTALYAQFIIFNMISCPGGTFPTGTDDSGESTVNAFYIGETEVTWELWSTVYEWAENGTGNRAGEGLYSIVNSGTMGDGTGDTEQHPVCTVSWRDTMVWCNALTEWYNALNGTTYTCSYFTDAGYTIPIRTVTASTDITETTNGSQDAPYVDANASGFRLPTTDEWECAARYLGTTDPGYGIELPVSSGCFWTPGGYASGAAADTSNSAATGTVAWYSGNSGSPIGSNAVRGKTPNQLALYDICGNSFEWCFDWTTVGTFRSNRGGSWSYSISYLCSGDVHGFYPWGTSNDVSFRPARNQ